MILNGDQILVRLKLGEIQISPADRIKLGTNSIDVHLAPVIKRPFAPQVIDPENPSEIKYDEIDLDRTQFILGPDDFILGSTYEYCSNNAKDLVPMIEGLSSLGRYGLSVHQTAGFGDIGFCGNWTLELSCKRPIILKPRMRIAQLFWLKTESTLLRYKGRYQNQSGTTEPKNPV